MTDTSQPSPSGLSLFWLVYGQIAAMLGAFSLLVFLKHFVDIGLSGIVREAFDGWVNHVRPVIGHPLQWIVDHLLPVEWHFAVPDVAKDYVGVGVVNAASWFRTQRVLGRKAQTDDLSYLSFMGFIVFFLILGWPLLFAFGLVLALMTISGVGSVLNADERKNLALLYSPLIYLSLLFAANAFPEY